MTTVVKPLGEATCLLPSERKGLNAGPAFTIKRHVHLPPPPTTVRLVLRERLTELAGHAAGLAAAASRHARDDASRIAEAQLRSVAANMARLAKLP